jgi:hypothetical protein
MDKPTTEVLAAHIERLEAELAMQRNRIATLEAQREAEYARIDRFMEMAVWAAARCSGGPFDMIERVLIGRMETRWANRRHEAAPASGVEHGGPGPAA